MLLTYQVRGTLTNFLKHVKTNKFIHNLIENLINNQQTMDQRSCLYAPKSRVRRPDDAILDCMLKKMKDRH